MGEFWRYWIVIGDITTVNNNDKPESSLSSRHMASFKQQVREIHDLIASMNETPGLIVLVMFADTPTFDEAT